MSDFFNNLVARTLNLAPVVQPRLTSLFEPVDPVATTAPADESVEVEETSEPSSIATLKQRAPLEAQLLPRTDRDRSPEDVRHVTVEHERIQLREVAQPRLETIQNTLLVPPLQNFSTHEIERLPTSEPPSRPAPRLDTAQVSQEVNKTAQTPIVAESESWRQLQPRVRNLIESRLSAVQPAQAVNDRVIAKTPATTPQPNVSRSIAHNEFAPVASTPRSEPRLEFQPEPMETINVTIGRVDVRAVFSQQATAPLTQAARARTPTVNSLEEYLKQRSEGRR